MDKIRSTPRIPLTFISPLRLSMDSKTVLVTSIIYDNKTDEHQTKRGEKWDQKQFWLFLLTVRHRPRRGKVNALLCSQKHVFSCHLLIGIGMLSVEKFSYCFGRKFSFTHVPEVPG